MTTKDSYIYFLYTHEELTKLDVPFLSTLVLSQDNEMFYFGRYKHNLSDFNSLEVNTLFLVLLIFY